MRNSQSVFKPWQSLKHLSQKSRLWTMFFILNSSHTHSFWYCGCHFYWQIESLKQRIGGSKTIKWLLCELWLKKKKDYWPPFRGTLCDREQGASLLWELSCTHSKARKTNSHSCERGCTDLHPCAEWTGDKKTDLWRQVRSSRMFPKTSFYALTKYTNPKHESARLIW